MNILAAKMKYMADCLSVPAMPPGGQLRLGQTAGSGCVPLQGAGQMGTGMGGGMRIPGFGGSFAELEPARAEKLEAALK